MTPLVPAAAVAGVLVLAACSVAPGEQVGPSRASTVAPTGRATASPLRPSRPATRTPAPTSTPRPASIRPRATQRVSTSHAPGRGWVGAMQRCIAHYESTNNPRAADPSGTYFGLYQFDRRSFRIASGGLPGVASDYSRLVQNAAFLVWFDDGKGRHRWTTYGTCQRLLGGPA